MHAQNYAYVNHSVYTRCMWAIAIGANVGVLWQHNLLTARVEQREHSAHAGCFSAVLLRGL